MEPLVESEVPRGRWQRRLLRLLAVGWVGAGLLAPLVAATHDPGLLRNGTTMVAVVLMLFAVAGSNVELRFSLGDTGPVFSPVGVPIVLAIVGCTIPQAMLVASMGYLLDRATWGRGGLFAIETAGLGAMSAGISALVVSALALSFDTPGSTLVAAIGATALFLVIDAATYAAWYHFEARSGGQVVRYFLGAAPIDVTFTAVAVVIVGPFLATPFAVALILIGCQFAIFALYRMATSEARHRAQSDHLRDVFSRYVPESVAAQLASSPERVRLGGELREVSVLFCDIRGFTSWAEAHDAEVVVRELNGLLGALAEVVMESCGTLDKFTGDGLMAFWGAPLEQLDHAERACRAALAMQALLERRNERVAADGGAVFRIGIGISSGQVVVGNVGHEQRLDYTAIGDTVNLAARLEQATKELGIATAVAHDTWEQLPDPLRARCAEVATVQVRGLSRPVRVHELGDGQAIVGATCVPVGTSASVIA